jgi:hypothetical protein
MISGEIESDLRFCSCADDCHMETDISSTAAIQEVDLSSENAMARKNLKAWIPVY